jgi:hypothetical protein
MKRNVASQVIGVQMITAADGTLFTGTTTVYVTGDAGTQTIGSVGSGVCTSEGRGLHTYAPAQAETNYDHIAFTFTGTGAIPATVQVFTSFPQTGDNFARLGAPAGASVSADMAAVKVDTAATLVDTAEIGTAGAGLTDLGGMSTGMKAEVNAECDTAISDASLATASALADVDTVVDAVLVDTGTTLPATLAGLNDIAASDILAANIEGTVTLTESLRLQNAALLGKVSGAATTTVVFRDLADSKDRITATVDADGNRSAVTLDDS